MSRMNGVGTWFLGVSRSASDPTVRHATSWVTFLWLPVFPLGRYKIKPIRVRPNHLQFQTLGKEKLILGEILRTYFFGLILMPLAALSPLVFSIKEVQEALGVPEVLQVPVMVFSILWLAGFVWKLKDWEENQWR